MAGLRSISAPPVRENSSSLSKEAARHPKIPGQLPWLCLASIFVESETFCAKCILGLAVVLLQRQHRAAGMGENAVDRSFACHIGHRRTANGAKHNQTRIR